MSNKDLNEHRSVSAKTKVVRQQDPRQSIEGVEDYIHTNLWRSDASFENPIRKHMQCLPFRYQNITKVINK